MSSNQSPTSRSVINQFYRPELHLTQPRQPPLVVAEDLRHLLFRNRIATERNFDTASTHIIHCASIYRRKEFALSLWL